MEARVQRKVEKDGRKSSEKDGERWTKLTFGCLHATGPSCARVVGRRVEKRKDPPSSPSVGGESSSPRMRSRKLIVTSSSIVARCTLNWTTFCGLDMVALRKRRVGGTQ